MKKAVFIMAVIMAVMAAALALFALSIPIVNDRVAVKTAESVKNIELPDNTEYIETFSEAAKLVGNGNGMQYLGGILIKSGLSLDELQRYYAQFAENEWEYIVERQTGQEIGFVEHGSVRLSAEIEDDTYFIVYSWGSNDSVFSILDIRGH